MARSHAKAAASPARTLAAAAATDASGAFWLTAHPAQYTSERAVSTSANAWASW